MQLLTIKGGWSMNRRFDIQNGTVRILKDGRHHECTLTVKNGRVTEAEDIEYPPDTPGKRIVTTKEKNKSEQIKAAAIRTISRYESYWNLPFEGVFHEMHGLSIGGHKGTLRQLSRQSRFVREEFVYENGQIAYIWTPYRKKFRLYRPDGSLWMDVATKIRRPWKRTEGLLEKINETLANIAGDGHTWSDQPNYEIRLYDLRGNELGYGKVANRQRTGIWRHGKAEYYFMMGVGVSKAMYYAEPDELDPREVLKTGNAQLRAALMKKIGPERLLKKLPFTTCNTDGDNRLLKADIKRIFESDKEFLEYIGTRSRVGDSIAIAVLKCPSTGQLYYLRVPPRLNKIEHARQWLCGVDIEALEEEYIRDRWTISETGDPRQLTQIQQQRMDNEIFSAKQRQRLEFVSEA